MGSQKVRVVVRSGRVADRVHQTVTTFTPQLGQLALFPDFATWRR